MASLHLRNELAALLRSLAPEDRPIDDLAIDRIVELIGDDRDLALFVASVVEDLIAEHEDLHGTELTSDCERCIALQDILRTVEHNWL